MFERVPTDETSTDLYPLHEPKQDISLMHSESEGLNIPLCRCGQPSFPDSYTIFSEKIGPIIKSKSIDFFCPICAVSCIKSIRPALPTDFIQHFAEKYTTRHNYVFFKFNEPSIVTDLRSLASDMGGKIDDVTYLPDGSGFACLSLPLPKDHWLFQPGYNVPPMPFRLGNEHPLRKIWKNALKNVGRYAVRAATSNGTEMDFDPDALVQNFIIGMIGYYTPTGLSADQDANPSPNNIVSNGCLTIPDLSELKRTNCPQENNS